MEPDRWLGVELRHLAALQALARRDRSAARPRRLGYTQSAVSQQIAALERIVGEQLVERPGGPRPVAMTEGGRLLLGHAEAIVARLKAAQADMAALSRARPGRSASARSRASARASSPRSCAASAPTGRTSRSS